MTVRASIGNDVKVRHQGQLTTGTPSRPSAERACVAGDA
jgi:hypothetical protein